MTSSLQPVGVNLVAGSLDAFTRAMSQADGASSKLGSVLQGQTAPGIEMVLAKGVLIGNVLTGAFDSAVSAMQRFVAQGIGAVEQLQDIQVGLETLVSREILYSKATDDINEALEMSGPIAEGLMEKLKDLSIQSPFQQSQIMSVFRMNMAFGQSSAMSLELTRAITNLGAANKGIPGILERLSYNFSQMSMIGKITSRDVRDLAMAGLDLEKVFSLTLGKTVKEVNADMEAGKITFEEVSKALVEYTDKYVGPAAERASKTLGGLKSTMADVAFFASGNLLMGAAENVTSALGGLLEIGLKIVNSDMFIKIGVVLETLTEPLDALGEKLANAANRAENNAKTLASMPSEVAAQVSYAMAHEDAALDVFLADMEAFGDKMIDTALDAFGWGMNIVTQFATGMIEGASNALVAAMDFVGNILAWFLAPGSPPRVAKNLDQWGAGAFKSYLEGFTQADFSVLDKIQGPLQRALQASLGDKAAIGAIMDLSKMTSEVLAGGGDPGAIFRRVADQTKMFGTEVAELVQQQLGLAAATEEVEKQEAALIKLRQRESEQANKRNNLVAEYNEMLRSGAGKAALDTKLAEINAQEDAVHATQVEAMEAEKALIAGKESLAPLEEKVKLQEQIVKQLTEMADWNKRLMDEAGGGGKGGGGKEPPGKLTPAGPDIETAVNEKLEALKEKIREKLAVAFDPVIAAWNERIKPALDELGKKWEWFSGIVTEFYYQYIDPPLQKLWGWLSEQGIPERLGNATGVMLVFGSAILVVGAAVAALGALLGILLSPVMLLVGAVGLLTFVWEQSGLKFKDVAMLGWMLVEIFRLLGLRIHEFAIDVIQSLTRFYNAWSAVIRELPEVIQGIFKELGRRLSQYIEDWKRWIADLAIKILETSDVMKGAFNGIADAIGWVVDKIKEAIDWFKKFKPPDVINPHSPTPLEMGFRGIGDAIESLTNTRLPALSRELARIERLDSGMVGRVSLPMLQPALVQQPQVVNNYNSTDVDMGGVQIRQPLDLGQFRSALNQVVRR